MDDHGFPAFAAAVAFLLGGLLAEFIQGTVALIGGAIALGAACGHYLARLRGFSEHRMR